MLQIKKNRRYEWKMFNIEKLRNVDPYIFVPTPVSMWSDFMWIHGKLNVPDIKYNW